MPDRSDAITKPRQPNTVDMGRDGSPSRDPIAKPTGTGESGGPGTYDPSPQYSFGKEVKSFTIGEKR